MKHRVLSKTFIIAVLLLVLRAAEAAAENPAWAWRDYRIVVKYLTGDASCFAPYPEEVPAGIASPEPPSVCPVPVALDLRVPLTPSGMVVGTDTQPAAYRAMATIRNVMGACCGDAAAWLPAAGSHVLFVGWHDAGMPMLDGSAPVSPTGRQTDDLYQWLIPGDLPGIPSWFLIPKDNLFSTERKGNVLARVLLTRVGADAVDFMTPLTGAAEEPPVVSLATGRLWLHASTAQLAITYTLFLSGISGPFDLHLHHDTAGDAAPPQIGIRHMETRAVPLFLGSGAISAQWLASSFTGGVRGLLRALRAGEVYADIHTGPFPAGELRGQFGAY